MPVETVLAEYWSAARNPIRKAEFLPVRVGRNKGRVVDGIYGVKEAGCFTLVFRSHSSLLIGFLGKHEENDHPAYRDEGQRSQD
jgi:hypothetical protein